MRHFRHCCRIRAAISFPTSVNCSAYRISGTGSRICLSSRSAPWACCEFVATHKETCRKFSVEAKAVTLLSRRAGPRAESPKIRGKLYDALSKEVEYSRIVFIELGRTHTINDKGEPDWAAAIDRDIEASERELVVLKFGRIIL